MDKLKFLSITLAMSFAPTVLAADLPIADFARHAAYQDAKISPNGEYLAVTAVVGERSVLGLIHLSDMKGVNISPREGDEITSFSWVGPSQVMYSVGEHLGGLAAPLQTGELYVVNGNGSEPKLLFGYRAGGGPQTASHISKVTAEFASGDLIAALRNDPGYALISVYPWNGPNHTLSYSGAFPEVYKLNLNDGRKTVVTVAPMRSASFLADHNGAIRFAYGTDVDQKRKVYYRPASGGDWQLVYQEGSDKDGFIPEIFDRDNKTVYVRCGGRNAVGGVCRWDPETRVLALLWSGKDASEEHLLETFDHQDAFGIRTQPGRPATVLLDKSAPEAALLASLMQQFPGADVRFTSASADGRKVVFLVQGDVEPGVFYLYDSDKKKATALIARRPWIKSDQMAQVEPIVVKARDGLSLHGYLSKPKGAEASKNLPLVVFVHGGPYGIRDEWHFDPIVQMLASRGYAVLQVNYRGSGGYGHDFLTAGYREWGGKMQDDVTDATRWAIEQGIADARRICIFGGSYGGYAALEGAVKEPDLYQCAIGYVGVYDLRLMSSRGDIPQSAFGSSYLQTVLGNDESVLWDRSPIAHLDSLKAKVMLIVGGADRRVPPIHGENLHNALDKRKIDHEWVYERTEGHGFYDEAHTTQMYQKLLAFLERNIGTSKAH